MKPATMKAASAALALASFAALGIALAQGETAKDEDADIMQELQRIIAQEPEKAPEAQKILDALNQPETSREGRQARNRRERGARRIVNGMPSRSHPAVGALLKGNDPKKAGAWCTGTLVGCDKFLTAAHCIAEDPSSDSYLVFFQELGFFQVKSIHWAKDKYDFPYFDLAMLTLEKPVEGIAPMPINATARPLNKSIATIVGFGRTGGERYDYGIKREGSVKTSACSSELTDKKVLCWRYDADMIANASAQNTCNADSGGGVFMRDNEGARIVEKVFGVVSGGSEISDCVKNDLSFNVDVSQYRDWIEAAGENSLSSAMCGAPLWSASGNKPVYNLLPMSDAAEARFTIEVPAGAAALRLAMNAEDNGTGKNEFAFTAFRGADFPTSVMCSQDGSGHQFAFCRVEAPQPGVWTVVVTRKKGAGQVQITALTERQ